MNAVTYWTAQQSYRLKLAESRAMAAQNTAMASDDSVHDSTVGSTACVSSVSTSSPTFYSPSPSIHAAVSVSSLELLHYRPNEFLIMPTKPSVPQVLSPHLPASSNYCSLITPLESSPSTYLFAN